MREECYDSCQERNRYSAEIEYVEKVEDLRNVYRESFENKIVIIDEKDNYYKDDRSEIVWLDKREQNMKGLIFQGILLLFMLTMIDMTGEVMTISIIKEIMIIIIISLVNHLVEGLIGGEMLRKSFI